MIDAATKAMEEGKIDSYTVDLNGAIYTVTVQSGAKSGEGRANSEEEAYKLALKAL